MVTGGVWLLLVLNLELDLGVVFLPMLVVGQLAEAVACLDLGDYCEIEVVVLVEYCRLRCWILEALSLTPVSTTRSEEAVVGVGVVVVVVVVVVVSFSPSQSRDREAELGRLMMMPSKEGLVVMLDSSDGL